MVRTRLALALAMAFPFSGLAQDAPARALGVVTVTGGQPTSLPTQIPTTMEGITREQIEQTINANDSEDALKYLPSLLVRKRYTGDYNHAVLSSRASGTGNSARSAVYADGILLSNFLGNGVGGLGFPPRWGMVTPEEIERVDVMYGPFSAAYPGNSVGAVVDYVTRMPTQFEAHGKVGYVSQPFALYNTDATYRSRQASASVGNRAGSEGQWAWFLNFNHSDSQSQPLTFATRLVSTGTPGTAGTPVTGAVAERNTANAPIWVLGTGTQYHTQQDHIKAKLAYDLSPVVRAAYTFGLWQNESQGRPVSYLRNAAGQSVSSGTINIDGRSYAALTGGDFALTDERLTHFMHGLSVKSHGKGVFDWEVAASLYGYGKDEKRQNGLANSLPAAASGGAGTIADGQGTGWNNLALKGIWRPQGPQGAHAVDFGWQRDSYKLAYLTSNIPGDYLSDGAGPVASDVGGRALLQSLYAQDAWAFAPRWKAVLGGRAEWWTASDGHTRIPGAGVNTQWGEREEFFVSPKAALSWQWLPDTVLKASAGRAVRMPTVSELYGGTSTTNAQYINDPDLQPEKSWTGELSAEKDLGKGLLRLTFFAEDTRDALYAQTTFDAAANRNVSRVQNVGRIATQGLELAYNGSGIWLAGLDLSGSLTYADSVIKENAGFVSVPGDTIGKRQPNIPKWRASALASYRWDAQWTTSLGARYSGQQYRTLDNSDVNGFTYMGVSKYFSMDLRARYQVNRHVSAAFGIDNLNNATYWNFHPYPQRSYTAELKVDL
ncbi:TonB-dependent receptor [uncultured Ramlibacter sp.]|uniref:TonB-dependent receptor n=1 Tax=uncultured Ramlibacter sp. TaxID=260755 RepID=UPI002604AE32|nr:TonB-dependent receptor [uncultured Ramlibacter sp.]